MLIHFNPWFTMLFIFGMTLTDNREAKHKNFSRADLLDSSHHFIEHSLFIRYFKLFQNVSSRDKLNKVQSLPSQRAIYK